MKGNLNLPLMYHTYSFFDMSVRRRGIPEHNKRIGDLFSDKHSGMDGLRWIPSYSQINLHTHTKTDGRGLKVMDAMYKLELLQARGQGDCMCACVCVCSMFDPAPQPYRGMTYV